MKKQMKLSQVANKVIQEWVRLGIEGWTKGADFRDKEGCELEWDMGVPKSVCKFCNEGLLYKVLKTNERHRGFSQFSLIDDAWKSVTGSSLVTMNDKMSMTFGRNLQNWFKVRSYLRKQEK